MHLMIFDPHEQGHYLTYVRYLLQAAGSAERVTLVLRQGVMGSAPYREQLESRVGNVTVDAVVRPESFHRGAQLFEDFANALNRHRPDHVWVPSGDLLARHSSIQHLTRRWRFAAGVEGECNLIELRFHLRPRRWRGHLRNFLDRSLLVATPWTRLHTIDPAVFASVRRRGGRLAERLGLVPDPVDTFTPISKQSARQTLAIPETGRYVGSIGAHAVPRKGSDLLVEAFSRATLSSTDRLLLVGPLGDKLRARLQGEFADLCRAGRIVTIDRYVDDQELMIALASMDVVCTPYLGHFGSSGIVLRAAQAERPVLAPHQGWLAAMVPQFGLGYTGDILSVQALAEALQRTVESSSAFVVSNASRRLIEYSAATNFGRMWAVKIRHRLGLPADRDLRSWAWVMEAFEQRKEFTNDY